MSLKEEVQDYIKKNGIKKSYFAAQINVSPCILSNWFSNKYSLNFEKEKLIRQIINHK